MMEIPNIVSHFTISIFEIIFGEFAQIKGSLFGDIIVNLNTVILTILGLIYSYQILFSFTSVIIKSKKFPDSKKKAAYIFLTSARNEEKVIAQLIHSIRALNYPQDKIAIHVIADNCDDETSNIAERLGAKVFKREDKQMIGKSHALNFYFKIVKRLQTSPRFCGLHYY